jgi:ABC-type uncharacterized transport system substrate-binding protein
MPIRILCAAALALALSLPPSGGALAAGLSAPVAKEDGKWRLAYMEGGDYANYRLVLKAVVGGLAKLEWLWVPEEFAAMGFPDGRSMWEWLGQNAQSPYLEFVQDAFWSEGWDKAARQGVRSQAVKRLGQAGDIDAVIAMGTWAGQDLANDEHETPVFVFQSSDPAAAGIVKSAEDSGLPHVFAHCDPTRYKRQVRLFHDIVGFGKLGIAYENTPTGRVYAAVDDVRQACEALGVTLVECHTLTNTPHKAEAVASYQACHESLAREVDAMYVTHSAAADAASLPALLAPFKRAKVPTFAQMGSEAVRAGALMSISQADFAAIGLFYARTISQALHGARPGSLPQVFEDPPLIALNLETAKAVGYNPPGAVLAAAEVIYSTALPGGK